ncbi:ABC transporter permease [Haloechinothrix sp. YIM 98757]|uniref:ABC transporter permease n=2 Tax=Haloechinothrix aidingensis TaxID=2752311 RepID=A0A838AC19_9PSEU|nr:ABC transporter permease [Haloechinothrix aidingensis]MBA0126777.1 ABC transporter permease [Haloechinothrix aidingensis]
MRGAAQTRPVGSGSGDTASVGPSGSASRGQAAVQDLGGLVAFAGHAIREVPFAIRNYPSEIVRHAGLLVRQNTVIVVFMLFMIGAVLALTLHFLFANIGITSYMGAESAVAATRGPAHVPFGWIIAAKIGCGIAAEIGAMRTNEEIDATDIMGVRSVAYLVSTRLVAAFFVMPFFWIIAMSFKFLAGFLFNVHLLGSVSAGGFVSALFLMQNTKDFTFAVIWATIMGLTIIVVGCYYGYTAKGGPLGVGRNTAQSMLVNMVFISIFAVIMVQFFYGNSPNAAIGN